MSSLNDAFDALLRKRIDEVLREMGQNAIVGVKVSLDAVNYNNGIAAGLKRCLDLCDDVKTEINQR